MTSALRRAAHDTVSPVQHGVNAVVDPIASFFAGAIHYGAVEQQNAKLRQELGRLKGQQLQGQSERQTLNALEKLQHLSWAGNIPTVTAEVVAQNPSNFTSTVQLDVGTKRGVLTGMPVVGGAGLVGTVIESWSSGCTVLLVSDPSLTVGVRFGSNPVYAAVQGRGFGKTLAVNLVPPGTQGLHKGEVLVTSGLSNASFPPSIPVATIKSFSATPSSIQESISAEPLADLAALQYVDVMLWSPQS